MAAPKLFILYNLQGEKVLEQTSGNKTIVVKNIDPGIYFYSVEFHEGEAGSVTGKVVIR
ncbi:MAG: T9SS type A sorting domain-containing protein [Bacteroidales bacterium]|nr:T9SS type A sorting domain-containing protein [Bacteroidales bacterium]